ncbi:hypothetical protein D9M71_535420 [compost metagenome]
MAGSTAAGVADPDQASRAVGPCLCLDLVGRGLAAGGAQPSPATSDDQSVATRPGRTGDALRRAVDRIDAGAPGRGGAQANHPGAALSTVRRQHHDYGHRRGPARGTREKPRRAVVGTPAVLRPTGIPRCAGGHDPAAFAAGFRSLADELSWLAGTASEEAQPRSQLRGWR